MGHQNETHGGLLGWVMRRGSEEGSMIIYCCAVKCTWLSITSLCGRLSQALFDTPGK